MDNRYKNSDKLFNASDNKKREAGMVTLTPFEHLVNAIEADDGVYQHNAYYIGNLFNNPSLRMKFDSYQKFKIESNNIDKKLHYMIKQGTRAGRQCMIWCEGEAIMSSVEYEVWKHSNK